MDKELTEQEQAEIQLQRMGNHLHRMLSGECKETCGDYQNNGDIACLDCFNYSDFW